MVGKVWRYKEMGSFGCQLLDGPFDSVVSRGFMDERMGFGYVGSVMALGSAVFLCFASYC